jgi:hypothetical protein
VGNLCHNCDIGFTKSANVCTECPEGFKTVGYALVAVFFVVFGLVVHVMIRSQYETTKKPGKRMSIRIKIFLSYFQVAILVSKVLQSTGSLEGSVLSTLIAAQAAVSPLVEPEPSSNKWLDCTFSALTNNGIYEPWLYSSMWFMLSFLAMWTFIIIVEQYATVYYHLRKCELRTLSDLSSHPGKMKQDPDFKDLFEDHRKSVGSVVFENIDLTVLKDGEWHDLEGNLSLESKEKDNAYDAKTKKSIISSLMAVKLPILGSDGHAEDSKVCPVTVQIRLRPDPDRSEVVVGPSRIRTKSTNNEIPTVQIDRLEEQQVHVEVRIESVEGVADSFSEWGKESLSEGSVEGEIYMDEQSYVMRAEVEYHKIAAAQEGEGKTIVPGGEAFIYARPEPVGPVANKNNNMEMPDGIEERDLAIYNRLSKHTLPDMVEAHRLPMLAFLFSDTFLEQCFCFLDTNFNKSLSLAECMMLAPVIGKNRSVFERFDTDKTGNIDMMEFLAGMRSLEKSQELVEQLETWRVAIEKNGKAISVWMKWQDPFTLPVQRSQNKLSFTIGLHKERPALVTHKDARVSVDAVWKAYQIVSTYDHMYPKNSFEQKTLIAKVCEGTKLGRWERGILTMTPGNEHTYSVVRKSRFKYLLERGGIRVK